MTNRQKQAIRTKKKIFDAAVYLMQKHGFEETTIEHICRKAGVSIGSFYNYFKSKQDVLFVVYESADIYFRDVVAPDLDNYSCSQKVLRFFSHYAVYNVNNGLDFVKRLYGNSENKLFINEDRMMHSLLKSVLAECAEKGIFISPMSVEDAGKFLFVLARGIVSDWCLYDGAYDMEQKMTSYMKLILPLFIKI